MSRRTPEAERAYVNRRNLLIARGHWHPFTDAARTRTHIRKLNQADISIDRIAELSRVSKTTLCRILYTQQATVRTEIHRRILAIKPIPDNRDPGRPIDATGTRRRLQALVASGRSLRTLADRLRMRHASVALIASGERREVYPATARAVADLYDQLWDRPPPQSTKAERISVAKARAFASRRQWAVAAAWDDDTIDHPDARPDLGAKTRRSDALAEDSDWLLTQGFTLEQIAERFGVLRDTLDKARERARKRVAA